MPLFAMLTTLSHGSLSDPQSLGALERQVMQRVRTECPTVEWVNNFAVLGPCDYLDIFKAPDLETAMQLATIFRTVGHANVEVWPATEWSRFKELISS